MLCTTALWKLQPHIFDADPDEFLVLDKGDEITEEYNRTHDDNSDEEDNSADEQCSDSWCS